MPRVLAVLFRVAPIGHGANSTNRCSVLRRKEKFSRGMLEEGVPLGEDFSHIHVEPGYPIRFVLVEALGIVDEFTDEGAGAGRWAERLDVDARHAGSAPSKGSSP
jgi:hypothetical protein